MLRSVWFQGILLFSLQTLAAEPTHQVRSNGHGTPDFNSKCHFVQSTDLSARKRPILVVIPGGPGLSSHSMGTLPDLSRRYDVCFLDPAGTGGTASLKSPSFDNLLDDIEKAVLALHRDVILVGHSFGGIVGAELAIRKKARVKALVLLGAPLSSESLEKIEHASHARLEGNPQLLAAHDKFTKHPEQENGLNEYLKEAATYYFAPSRVEEGKKMLDGEKSNASLFQAYEDAKQLPLKDLPERLKTASVPVLQIAATEDKITELEFLKADGRRAGGVPLTEIAGAGHFFPFEKPSETSRAILDFLEDKALALSTEKKKP